MKLSDLPKVNDLSHERSQLVRVLDAVTQRPFMVSVTVAGHEYPLGPQAVRATMKAELTAKINDLEAKLEALGVVPE